MLLNGPESFTLDGNFILGEAPELAGYFVCAGFNSAGIANAGGAGRLIAEWIVGGEAPLDLWDVDIRRFAPLHANRRHLADRTVESLGLHYAMRWPREELADGAAAAPLAALRPACRRRAPCSAPSSTGSAPTISCRAGAARAAVHARHAGMAAVRARRAARVPRGRRRVRPDVVRQIRAEGPRRARRAAAAVRQRHRRRRRPHGLHGDAQRARRLRERPHDHARRRATTFFILTGSAQATRDFAWIERHIGADEHAALVDVTSAYSVLSRDGAEGRGAARARCRRDDLSQGGAAVLDDARDRRRLRARARRADELRRRPRLRALRADRPVRDALRRAVARRRARSACATPATTRSTRCASKPAAARGAPSCRPTRRRWEAGLGYAVEARQAGAVHRPRRAAARSATRGVRKRLVQFTFDDPAAFPWGGEPVLMDGRNVGELTSAGYSRTLGRAVAMGYARARRMPTLTDATLARGALRGRHRAAKLFARHAARCSPR